jgi:hypothetical protein
MGPRQRKRLGLAGNFDGGFLIPAQTGTVRNGYGALLLKTNSDGDSLWMQSYEPEVSEGLASAVELRDGSYMVSGISGSIGEDTDFYLIKVDDEGNLIWSRTYPQGGLQSCHTMIQTKLDGGFLLGGYNYRRFQESWLVKTDAEGEYQWDLSFGDQPEYGVTGIWRLHITRISWRHN